MLSGSAARCAAALQAEGTAQLLGWMLLRCTAQAPQALLLVRLGPELRLQQAVQQQQPHALLGALQLQFARHWQQPLPGWSWAAVKRLRQQRLVPGLSRAPLLLLLLLQVNFPLRWPLRWLWPDLLHEQQ